jgi:hypothetical protein
MRAGAFRDRTWRGIVLLAAATLGGLATDAAAENPVVVFDVPLCVECRDAPPKARQAAHPRKIIKAVFKISPQMYAGKEKDLTRIRYEVSTEQQVYFRKLAAGAQDAKTKAAENVLASVGRMFASRVVRSSPPSLRIGAAVEAGLADKQDEREQLPQPAREAGDELAASKQGILAMNGK